MPLTLFYRILLACLLGCSILGCGKTEEALHQVSGTVTYQGAPVPMGTIFFDPDASKGGSGMQGFADIRDGKFDTAAGGRGVRGGAYIMRIQAYDGTVANAAPYGQALFPEYQTPKELPQQSTTLDIEVPSV